MAVTDAWADWSTTAASNGPAGAATPEVDDEFRNIKAQCKANAFTASSGGATQAIQETGTSTAVYVSPGVQKYHPSAAKAWVDFAGNSTTIAAAFNVTSITDGTNRSTANYTVAFSSTGYSCSVTVTDTAAKVGVVRTDNKLTTALMVDFYVCADGSATDPYACQIIAFGDQ